MSLDRGFKPLSGLAASENDLDAFASRKGIPELQPKPEIPASPQVIPLPARPAPVMRRFNVEVPEYIADQIYDRARAERCTARHVIMQALRASGLTINEDDMISDGRRRR